MKHRKLLLALFLASLLLVLPRPRVAQAFTSLQGCYQRPACAKMLIDAGMVGSSVAPQGVVTTSSAASAAAAGAGAAKSIVVPQLLADGVAVGGGIAALYWPWSQEKADKVSSLYRPPFVGGQEAGVLYRYRTERIYEFQPDDTCNSWSSHAFSFVKPQDVGKYYSSILSYRESFGPLSVEVTQTTCGTITHTPLDIERVDGQVDDSDSLPPQLLADQLPTTEQLTDLFGPPTEVPWPAPDPGPDGETGTDDDVYSPLVFPGPTISPDTFENPRYLPADFILPNPLANPGTDPETETGTGTGTGTATGTETEGTEPAFDPSLFEGASPDPESIRAAQFSKPHFLAHAFSVFSDKFPLDVIGEFPEGYADICPVFTFFNESFELCIIIDFMRVLKIPAVLSFTIWALLSL